MHADIHLNNIKSSGREWIVKPSPKILASEQKATTMHTGSQVAIHLNSFSQSECHKNIPSKKPIGWQQRLFHKLNHTNRAKNWWTMKKKQKNFKTSKSARHWSHEISTVIKGGKSHSSECWTQTQIIVHPTSRPHGGQTESLWEHNYVRQGSELSMWPSFIMALLTKNLTAQQPCRIMPRK